MLSLIISNLFVITDSILFVMSSYVICCLCDDILHLVTSNLFLLGLVIYIYNFKVRCYLGVYCIRYLCNLFLYYFELLKKPSYCFICKNPLCYLELLKKSSSFLLANTFLRVNFFNKLSPKNPTFRDYLPKNCIIGGLFANKKNYTWTFYQFKLTHRSFCK